MAYILHIDTSQESCNVAISNKIELLAFKEIKNGLKHAECLATLVQELLTEAKIEMQQLNAVALMQGPGSYTGLRIGTSFAKGICYALNIPLIAYSTLLNMAVQALNNYPGYDFYIAAIDAKRDEVYYTLLDSDKKTIIADAPIVLTNSFLSQYANSSFCIVGSGATKVGTSLSNIKENKIDETIGSSVRFTIKRVYAKYFVGNFEDVAYFEPKYLKNVYIG